MASKAPPTTSKIARRIQFQIGLVIAMVIVAVTLLAYQTSIRNMREDALAGLVASMTNRANYDSAAFLEAEKNTYLLRDEYLRRLTLMANEDPVGEFDAWFARSPDGLIRVRPERDDHMHLPSIYIRASVALTPEVRRRVVVAFKLLREWGPAMTQRYFSTYIDLPAVSLIMFSPSVNWGKEADKTTNNFDYPPVRNSSPEKNPGRENRWTEVYWDDKAQIYMVSTITPADKGKDWVGTVSQDMAVSDLVKRTVAHQIPGTYNLLFDNAGLLLVHPQKMDAIAKAGGNLDIKVLNDPELASIDKLALEAGEKPEIRESVDGENYLGISRIQGPDWRLVTVYPKALLEGRAVASAQIILFAGLLGLAIELLLLAWIIRREVAVPLLNLSAATASVAQSDLHVILDDSANHELGRLARNFMHMATRLRERDHVLKTRAEELENEIAEREQSERRMQYMATHDALTGLANRTLLSDRLQQAISAAQRSQQVIALLYIDLDNFKTVNDTLGHDAGDAVLKRVAERVSVLLRKSDTLSRLGGDEFVLLLPSIGSRADAMTIARKIIASSSEAIEMAGVHFAVTPSIGISCYPEDGLDAQTLLKHADIAMYRAKASGRNAFECFTPDMGLRASEVMPMESAIRDAIRNGEFELYFQPQVDARSRGILSVEALIRWNRPGQGVLAPAAFLPFAEARPGLMQAIDSYVLQTACEHLLCWNKAGVMVPIAVNLSASQFARTNLVDQLATLIAQYGIKAGLLTLEVTEGALLTDAGSAAENMAALRDLGIRVSVDDFGTGYSSLSYLHRFAVDELKIDQSFVSKIGRSDKDTALARAIIGIGRDLDLHVVAEGVETEDQAEFLKQRGCNSLQGYLFYVPLQEQQLFAALAAQRMPPVGVIQ
ncbi:MAG: EAL domain-containing protein [Rhodocyclaceae bacterium]|nr:EAL domain-containing protein [Rhodocyclaceae bacterium]